MVSEGRRVIPQEFRIGNTTRNTLDYHSRTSQFIKRNKKEESNKTRWN
jgi:hypothetical protein